MHITDKQLERLYNKLKSNEVMAQDNAMKNMDNPVIYNHHMLKQSIFGSVSMWIDDLMEEQP